LVPHPGLHTRVLFELLDEVVDKLSKPAPTEIIHGQLGKRIRLIVERMEEAD
jgi:hypothetical protein